MRSTTGGRPRLNATFAAFAAHWGFTPRLCQPCRAPTKGKVESGVKYVKRNFVPGRVFRDLADFNAQLAAWQQAKGGRCALAAPRTGARSTGCTVALGALKRWRTIDNSVKRFVHTLRQREPEQFDRLEFLRGEEMQIDYGKGAPTRLPGTDRYRKPLRSWRRCARPHAHSLRREMQIPQATTTSSPVALIREVSRAVKIVDAGHSSNAFNCRKASMAMTGLGLRHKATRARISALRTSRSALATANDGFTVIDPREVNPYGPTAPRMPPNSESFSRLGAMGVPLLACTTGRLDASHLVERAPARQRAWRTRGTVAACSGFSR